MRIHINKWVCLSYTVTYNEHNKVNIQYLIGRKNWLKKLEDLSHLKRSRIVVVKGRRRIGKSRLSQEFAKNKSFFSFAGVALADGINAQDQKNNFIFQLSSQLKISQEKEPIKYTNDWSQVLSNLTNYITQEETVILLDEISWIGNGDSSFVPKLKNWWDLELQKFLNLTVVLIIFIKFKIIV